MIQPAFVQLESNKSGELVPKVSDKYLRYYSEIIWTTYVSFSLSQTKLVSLRWSQMFGLPNLIAQLLADNIKYKCQCMDSLVVYDSDCVSSSTFSNYRQYKTLCSWRDSTYEFVCP